MSPRTAERSLSVGDVGRVIDPKSGQESLRVMLGAGYACRDGSRLITLLGSCVAVCLFDSESGVGGMNHFMLPENNRDRIPPSDLRFGIDAMPWLIQAVRDLGGSRKNLKAKIFGGGAAMGGALRIGYGNIDSARDALAAHAIPVLAEDVGKVVSRQVRFETATGRAYVRYLDSGLQMNVLQSEKAEIEPVGDE